MVLKINAMMTLHKTRKAKVHEIRLIPRQIAVIYDHINNYQLNFFSQN